MFKNIKTIKAIAKFWSRVIWKKYDGGVVQLTEQEYNGALNSNEKKRKAAYEKAWESRKFEMCDVQKLSLTQTAFEEAFNKYLAASSWIPIGDLNEYYKKRKLLELAGNVWLIAQEFTIAVNIFYPQKSLNTI